MRAPLDQIAALPLGARIKLDPWTDQVELAKAQPVALALSREKMPFEVTPFMPYLTRYGSDAAKPIAASAVAPADPNAKPGDPAPANPQ